MRFVLLMLLAYVCSAGAGLFYLLKFAPNNQEPLGMPLAIRFWVDQLEDPDAGVRLEAVDNLGALGPDARPAVPALARRLRDAEVEVRRHAAFALGEIGPPARSAVPALTMAMSDWDKGVLYESIRAVGRIDAAPRTCSGKTRRDRTFCPILLTVVGRQDSSADHRSYYSFGMPDQPGLALPRGTRTDSLDGPLGTG